MRTLLVLALLVLAGAGYLSYFNDGTVTLAYAEGRNATLGVVPLVLACVALGLLMGIGGTAWHDVRGFFGGLGRRHRERQAERVRHLLVRAGNERLAGRVDKAQELYRRALKAAPEDLEAVMGLADLLRQRGMPKDAIALHRLATRLAPEVRAYRLAVIDDYVAMESYERAAQQIEAALADDARHQALLTRLRELKVATSDWSGAAEAQERLLKTPMEGLDSRTEATRLTGLKYEAAVALATEGHATEAERALRDLTRESPDFAPAHMALGGLLFKGRGPAEALAAYQEGYEHTRDESFLPPIENLLIVHLEDPQAAVDYFTRLVDRDPKSLRLRYWLGRVHYRLEMIDDALHVLTRVEQAVTAFPELSALLGRIHLRRGSVAEAAAALGEGSPPITYACDACGAFAEEWRARCASCGRWGSVGPRLRPVPRAGSAAGVPVLLPAPA
jgi:lipopolysaccharide biosynthesis regulator YciM